MTVTNMPRFLFRVLEKLFPVQPHEWPKAFLLFSAATLWGMSTSVSRAAGLALTKALSKENAPHNVLVNAMLVGLIESDQWVRRHKALGKDQTFQQFIDGMAKGRIPIGRMGKSEEFARMACFLCSDAGSFITGVAINVDGGASPVV